MKAHYLALAIGLYLLANADIAQAATTTLTFDGIAPANSFVGYSNGPATFSGVTFSTSAAGDIFVVDPGFYGNSYSSGFLTDDYAGTTDTLSISLPGNVHSISFDFGGLFSSSDPISALVAINGGPGQEIDTSDSIESGSLQHFSFSSVDPISTMTLVLPDAPVYSAIDNFSFSTGGAPEPATWAMMMLGFFGLGFLVRRSSVGANAPA
jgi:hypothetical protein